VACKEPVSVETLEGPQVETVSVDLDFAQMWRIAEELLLVQVSEQHVLAVVGFEVVVESGSESGVSPVLRHHLLLLGLVAK